MTEAARTNGRDWTLATLACLCASAVGLALLCAGAVLEVRRHEDMTGAERLVDFTSVGGALLLVGAALAAIGLLVALSLVAFERADSAGEVIGRGIVVVAAWIVVTSAVTATLVYTGTKELTHDHGGAFAPAPIDPETASQAILSGSVTLDGAPFDAEFLGVRVLRDGRYAACQGAIPPVQAGLYEVPVMSDAEVRGCGASGATLILWTSIGDQMLYSSEDTPWPGDGGSSNFDAAFSRAAPAGASLPATEFYGLVHDRDGNQLPGGTDIEAYVNGTLCGATTSRESGFEGYVLAVSGPELIPECAANAPISFRIDGEPALEEGLNDLNSGADYHKFDLTRP